MSDWNEGRGNLDVDEWGSFAEELAFIGESFDNMDKKIAGYTLDAGLWRSLDDHDDAETADGIEACLNELSKISKKPGEPINHLRSAYARAFGEKGPLKAERDAAVKSLQSVAALCRQAELYKQRFGEDSTTAPFASEIKDNYLDAGYSDMAHLRDAIAERDDLGEESAYFVELAGLGCALMECLGDRLEDF
jgi:hypothetical protein